MISPRTRRVLIWTVIVVAVLLTLKWSLSGGSTPRAKFAARPTSGIGQLLEDPPKYSSPGSSSYAKNYTPSPTQYAEYFYTGKAVPVVEKQLQDNGVDGIAHILWLTDDHVQTDVEVLHFGTEDGSERWLEYLQQNTLKDTDLKSYSIDTRGAPIVYYQDSPDDKGNWFTKAYARYGTYVVEMFMISGQAPNRILVQRYITSQVARLPE